MKIIIYTLLLVFITGTAEANSEIKKDEKETAYFIADELAMCSGFYLAMSNKISTSDNHFSDVRINLKEQSNGAYMAGAFTLFIHKIMTWENAMNYIKGIKSSQKNYYSLYDIDDDKTLKTLHKCTEYSEIQAELVKMMRRTLYENKN